MRENLRAAGGLLSGMDIQPTDDKPCAAAGLLSYRYRGRFGFIMIGALNDEDALKSAQRSMSFGKASLDMLERWNGTHYAPVVEPAI